MSNRSDTCTGKGCPFWDRYGDRCPNYVEGKWVTNDGHEYSTKDCAPKRSMILTQQIYDRMIGVQKSHDQARNANIEILRHVVNSQPGVIDIEINEPKKIEG